MVRLQLFSREQRLHDSKLLFQSDHKRRTITHKALPFCILFKNQQIRNTPNKLCLSKQDLLAMSIGMTRYMFA